MAKPVLEVDNIEVIYNRSVQVLRGLSFHVPQGGIVALLGANGAGKTTTLKAITNVLSLEDGDVTAGAIRFQGEPVRHAPPHRLVRRGMAHVMEGRRIFADLTLEENLNAATYALTGRPTARPKLELVYEYFPPLWERRKQIAGYLSGGEQQMLAIGRALIAEPTLMLLDEPSLGLAPMLVEEIFGIIYRINREQGVSMLLVEQNAVMAFAVSTYGYIMETGRIVIDGPVAVLTSNEDVKEFYLGTGTGGAAARNYRDVKHYKRRKRWLS